MENAWCDQCGEYDCTRHSLLQVLLTAAIAGGLIGFVTVLLVLVSR
jgi:hypothetical protein